MGFGYELLTWRGHAINDGNPYRAVFLVEDSEILNTLEAPAVQIERPGLTPLRAFSQPRGLRFAVEITIDGELSQDNLDQLKEWFDPTLEDEGELIAISSMGSGDNRRIRAVVERLEVSEGVNIFKAHLFAPLGMWEDASLTTPTPTVIDVSPKAFTLTNPGTAYTPLIVRLTANDVSATRQTKMRRCYLANRSQEALQHFANEGYPVEITGGGIDTTNASEFRNDLNDLRVLLNGDEVPRWVYPATANAATKVWCNLHFAPGKHARLAAAIDASDNTLTVSNPEGFAGWPANGWLFVDDEPMQYVGAAGFSAGTLVRPFPTSHDAGADIWWIEHVPVIIHGDADAEAPPDWSDEEPVLDLSVSTNTLHRLNGPFFNNADLRSRTALRRLPDSGRDYIRTYDDAEGKLRWEDMPAEAGKPPLSVVAFDFPVPVTSFQLDYAVEQSLVLDVTGIDYGRDGGFVTDLLTAFWTNGTLINQTVSPANPMKRIEMEARLAAVVGEVETSGVSLITELNMGATARVENPFFESLDSQIESVSREIRQLILDGVPTSTASYRSNDTGWIGGAPDRASAQITINMPVFVHFVLEKETRVDAVLLYGKGGTCWLYFDNGGAPSRSIINFAIPGGNAQLRVGQLDKPVVLAPGAYWLKPSTEFGIASGRRDPNLWFGYHDVFYERAQTYTFASSGSIYWIPGPGVDLLPITFSWDEQAEVEIPTRDSWHQDIYTSTPVFAILSRDTEPDPSAPVETGLIATVDNLRFTLDSTLAPLIYVGPTQDMLLVDGNLTNETTGQEMDILFPLAIGESLQIDTETGEVTDEETGLPAPHAVAFSQIRPRLQLAPGNNSLVWTMAGVQDMTLAPSFRGRYL